MTVLSTDHTRSNRDIMIFCLIAAIISGALAASVSGFIGEHFNNDRQDIHIAQIEKRVDKLEVDIALLASHEAKEHQLHQGDNLK